MRRSAWMVAAGGVLALAVWTDPGLAWHGSGHARAARAALSVLPEDLPGFLVAGGDTVAHCSVDPDLFTRPIAPDDLHASEAPEHYFDLERLGGADIPARRYDLLTWCVRNNLEPDKVGLLPYAITEWTQRLTVALAEHRKWPEDPNVRLKCLVYAGVLAHYAADLAQPLHTTIHYDGRLRADGSSPRSGIHLKTDALLGKLPAGLALGVESRAVQPFEKVLPAVLTELKASHGLVDRVYELEKDLPAYEEPLKGEGPVFEFARERLAAAALLTARLYATAWRDSAGVQLPAWHVRPADAPGTMTAPAATGPAAASAPVGHYGRGAESAPGAGRARGQ